MTHKLKAKEKHRAFSMFYVSLPYFLFVTLVHKNTLKSYDNRIGTNRILTPRSGLSL